jgi:hypothetical protein
VCSSAVSCRVMCGHSVTLTYAIRSSSRASLSEVLCDFILTVFVVIYYDSTSAGLLSQQGLYCPLLHVLSCAGRTHFCVSKGCLCCFCTRALRAHILLIWVWLALTRSQALLSPYLRYQIMLVVTAVHWQLRACGPQPITQPGSAARCSFWAFVWVPAAPLSSVAHSLWPLLTESPTCRAGVIPDAATKQPRWPGPEHAFCCRRGAIAASHPCAWRVALCCMAYAFMAAATMPVNLCASLCREDTRQLYCVCLMLLMHVHCQGFEPDQTVEHIK